MTKPSTITVRVAAGCHVTVPHPSGIRELPARILSGGAEFQIDPATAADLYAARLINDPVTGAPPPPAPAVRKPSPQGVTIQVGNGPRRALDDGLSMGGWDPAAHAQLSTEDRAPLPPAHDCNGGFVGEVSRSGGPAIVTGFVPIETADGRPWPSY